MMLDSLTRNSYTWQGAQSRNHEGHPAKQTNLTLIQRRLSLSHAAANVLGPQKKAKRAVSASRRASGCGYN